MKYENDDGTVIVSGGDLASFGLVVNEYDVRQTAAAARVALGRGNNFEQATRAAMRASIFTVIG